MSRLVRITADAPVELKPCAHSVWICRCGLSQNQPFCDGSHVQTRSEEPGQLYLYDPVTQRPCGSCPDNGVLKQLSQSLQ